MKAFIKKLAQHNSLSAIECQQALTRLSEKFIPEQVGAFLSLLHSKPETSDELQGVVQYLQSKMHQIRSRKPALDIVGTGGDSSNTVNISSAASLLCASLGVITAKHGNRSVSSRCGSADLMSALGMTIDLTPAQGQALLEKTGFTFLYAPNFHPALAQFKSLRESLGIPTIFNLAGPLVNPVKPDYLVLGVYHPRLMPVYADFLVNTSIKRALIVHSQGLDEASLLGDTEVIEINGQSQQRYTIKPEDFNLKPCELSAIRGDDADTNQALIRGALSGNASAISDTIALNSGCALYASHHCESIAEGVRVAQQQLTSGKAIAKLEAIIECSKNNN